MKIKVNAILTLVVLSLLLVIIVSRAFIDKSKENILIEVYDKYDFDVLQINMLGQGILNNEYMTYDNMDKILMNILKELNIHGEVEINKKEFEKYREYKVSRAAKDAETVLTIISTKNDNNEYESNLKCNMVLYEKLDGVCYLQDKINEIFSNLKVKPDVNITMAGSYDKKFKLEESKTLANKIMRSLRAKTIDEYENERLYSVYGFTDMINESIVADGENINVNVALRYNEYEDKTYLYMASPVISVDY